MTPPVYYNEIDPKAAAWLRELISEGHLPQGEVDERDIRDILPSDLAPFTQCHFFAGIGGWPLALKLANWPANRPVWTGSCPCQSFSAAGGRKGFADERHLWPSWFHLISQCMPHTIFGEQVEAAIKHNWLDLVQDDLEGIGYEVGACGLPAAGVGAPHIRARLWFVAESNGRHASAERQSRSREQRQQQEDGGVGGSFADAKSQWNRGGNTGQGGWIESTDGGNSDKLEHPPLNGRQQRRSESGWGSIESRCGDDKPLVNAKGKQVGVPRRAWESREPITFWSNSVHLPCIDGKSRPTEPTIFPLAHGIPGRVGLLRGAGNAIVPPLAAEFIKAYLDIYDENLHL